MVIPDGPWSDRELLNGVNVSAILASRIRLSLCALGKEKADVDLDSALVLRILTSLLHPSRFSNKRLRRRFESLPVAIRLRLDQEILETVISNAAIAHRMTERGITIQRLRFAGGQAEIEIIGHGKRAAAAFSVAADERMRRLIMVLGPNNLPGGVWPSELSEYYPNVEIRRQTLLVNLAALRGVQWRPLPQGAELRLDMSLGQVLNMLHL